jgi:hypothetical protein
MEKAILIIISILFFLNAKSGCGNSGNDYLDFAHIISTKPAAPSNPIPHAISPVDIDKLLK